MRTILAILLAASSVGLANASKPDNVGDWAAGDWRIVRETKGAVMLIDNHHIRRAGQAATFEVLTVRQNPNRRGVDHYVESFLIDCASSKLRMTDYQGFKPNGETDLPLNFPNTAGDTGHVPLNPVLAQAGRMACGLEPINSTAVKSPIEWARRNFRAVPRP